MTLSVLLMSDSVVGLGPHVYLQILILPFIHFALFSAIFYRKKLYIEGKARDALSTTRVKSYHIRMRRDFTQGHTPMFM